MKPNEIESLPLGLEKICGDLESNIMEDICRRLKKAGKITKTADYQLGRLSALGNSSAFLSEQISKFSNLSEVEVNAMFEKALKYDYTDNKKLYDVTNTTFVPYAKNAYLQQQYKTILQATNGTLQETSKSLGFMVRGDDGKLKPTLLSDYYNQVLDKSILSVSSGAFSYTDAINSTVSDLTNSGLRYINFESGSVRRIETHARTVVMGGVNSFSQAITDQNAKAIGADKFEVSVHSGSRPDHMTWQGGIYTQEELVSVCGLGDVAGLLGANCRHSYYPFLDGYSEPSYSQKELDAYNAEEMRVRTYRGKEYNAYTATQRSRQLEAQMRAQRQKISLLQNSNIDGELDEKILNAKIRHQVQLQGYNDFCKSVDIKTQMERVRVDGINASTLK